MTNHLWFIIYDSIIYDSLLWQLKKDGRRHPQTGPVCLLAHLPPSSWLSQSWPPLLTKQPLQQSLLSNKAYPTKPAYTINSSSSCLWTFRHIVRFINYTIGREDHRPTIPYIDIQLIYHVYEVLNKQGIKELMVSICHPNHLDAKFTRFALRTSIEREESDRLWCHRWIREDSTVILKKIGQVVLEGTGLWTAWFFDCVALIIVKIVLAQKVLRENTCCVTTYNVKKGFEAGGCAVSS